MFVEGASSSSTKYATGRSSAAASLSRVVIVGTMLPCSTLWMAAGDTSDRSESCCSDSPRTVRSSRIFGPIELTTSETSVSAAGPSSRLRRGMGRITDDRATAAAPRDAVGGMRRPGRGRPMRGWRRADTATSGVATPHCRRLPTGSGPGSRPTVALRRRGDVSFPNRLCPIVDRSGAPGQESGSRRRAPRAPPAATRHE